MFAFEVFGTCCSVVTGEDPDFVVGGLEADPGAADVVNDDGVQLLTREFAAPVVERALAVLGGEPDDQLAVATALGERGEHVRSTDETQVQFPAGAILLELAVVRVLRPVIGDRGGHQQHVAGVEARGTGIGELCGGLHVDIFDARWALDRHVGGDHGHVGAALPRLGGEREPHTPGRAVAHETHRVDRLACPAGGHEHAQTVEFATHPQDALDRRQQFGRLRQPADAELARRAQRPRPRLEHRHSARAQPREIGLGGWVLVHRVVHGRSDDQRSPARERRGGQQVVGAARRELRNRMSGRGSDQIRVGVLDQREVRERGVRGQRVAREDAAQRVRLPLGHEHRRAGDPGERSLPDEARGRVGLHHAHLMARLQREAGEFQRLVCRDAAAHTEQDARHVPPP